MTGSYKQCSFLQIQYGRKNILDAYVLQFNVEIKVVVYLILTLGQILFLWQNLVSCVWFIEQPNCAQVAQQIVTRFMYRMNVSQMNQIKMPNW